MAVVSLRELDAGGSCMKRGNRVWVLTLVQVDVVVLAEIHSDVHGKAGEASFKSSFESILLVLLTSTMLDRNHSSFCQSSLIQLIKSSILDFNE